MCICQDWEEITVKKFLVKYELYWNLINKIMKQILIPSGISKDLQGKTIEKTSFYTNMGDTDENHLVIKFTDGTHISVIIDYDNGYYLSEYIPSLSRFSANSLGYIRNGEFCYRSHYQQLIDIGAVEPLPEDKLKEEILNKERIEELREYAQYEKLKKKYDNYNPRKKYGIE